MPALKPGGAARSHRSTLLPLALLTGAFGGCEGQQGTERGEDAGFVEAEVSVVNDASGSGDGSGCLVLEPDDCAGGRACCTPDEKCVLTTTGSTACTPAGTGVENERCGGEGVDDCAFPMLCAEFEEIGPRGRRCRVLCVPGQDDCETGTCVPIDFAGQSFGVCGVL